MITPTPLSPTPILISTNASIRSNRRSDLDAITGFDRPVLLTEGVRRPPFVQRIVELLAHTLPAGTRRRLPSAAHDPQRTNPTVAEFPAEADAGRRRVTR